MLIDRQWTFNHGVSLRIQWTPKRKWRYSCKWARVEGFVKRWAVYVRVLGFEVRVVFA